MCKGVEVNDKYKERKPKSADEALQGLMRLCSRAEKSSGDALRLMRTWGVAESERGGVLSKLIEMRFIDDERYAEAYCREKVSVSGWGVRKIAQQLRLKGVADDIIARYPDINADNVLDILKAEVGAVFSRVLECAGVYKCTKEGREAFVRFVDHVNSK